MKRLIAIIISLFLASQSLAVPTYVQSLPKNCAGVSSCSQTFASSTTTGNLIVVAIASYYNPTVNSPQSFSVADNKGNTACYSTDDDSLSTFFGEIKIFHCENITGGASHQITVSSVVTSYWTMDILEYSGIATTSAFDKGTTNDAGASPVTTYTSTTVGTTNANDLLLGFHFTYAAPTWTPDSPWTNVDTFSGTYTFFQVVQQNVSSTGNYADTGSVTGDSYHVYSSIVSYKASGGGTPAPKSCTMPLLGV